MEEKIGKPIFLSQRPQYPKSNHRSNDTLHAFGTQIIAPLRDHPRIDQTKYISRQRQCKGTSISSVICQLSTFGKTHPLTIWQEKDKNSIHKHTEHSGEATHPTPTIATVSHFRTFLT
jgi:hypothetical protein